MKVFSRSSDFTLQGGKVNETPGEQESHYGVHLKLKNQNIKSPSNARILKSIYCPSL